MTIGELIPVRTIFPAVNCDPQANVVLPIFSTPSRTMRGARTSLPFLMLLNVNAMLLALLSVDERFNSLARPAPLPANTQVFDPAHVLIVP
jgi:hypothetical protein